MSTMIVGLQLGRTPIPEGLQRNVKNRMGMAAMRARVGVEEEEKEEDGGASKGLSTFT